jgi:4-hydroxy-2-oxoglutarate aldolase
VSAKDDWNIKLHGLFVPFPTPFDAEGEVNGGALKKNIERWLATGPHGFVALGSTGERVHLAENEARRVVAAAREAVPSDKVFVVGVGQHGTRGTIAEARQAAADGADAVLVMTPHFYRAAMTQTVLAQHFRAVAEASPVPVLLYHIPQNTGVALTPASVVELSAHENIIGVKDSSGDILNLAEMTRAAAPGFAVLTGHGGALYAALCTGAVGAILAVSCVAAEFILHLMQIVHEGQHERAVRLQQLLTPLADAVGPRYGIGGLKAALETQGYFGGPVRSPLNDASAEAKRELARLLEKIAAERGWRNGTQEKLAA